jgi:hypothetical protein
MGRCRQRPFSVRLDSRERRRRGQSRRDLGFWRLQEPHDKIDLHKIDADPDTAADDAFTFVSDAQFSGTAGELRYDDTEGLVQADVNGDGTADFEIAMAPNINDLHPILTIDDFRL